MQLQQDVKALEARGIGLAAISYDAPAILKAFAAQHGISFPLLSDTGSETIKRYDLLNAAATGRTAGIPHPGTFVLDSKGIVVSRSFEESYQERASAASLAAQSGKPESADGIRKTPHLSVAVSSSDAPVAPGTRFSLLIDVLPARKMHVYGPEQKDLIGIAFVLAADPAVKIHPAIYPTPERFFFKPLGETQLVYSKPFRIVEDVTVALSPAMRERARADGAALSLSGTLRYQACDDKVCYLPTDVPLAWTIPLRPLAR